MRQSLHFPSPTPDTDQGVQIQFQGGITLYLNSQDFDFYIDAPEDHKRRDLSIVLQQAKNWGLEPVDPETESEIEIPDHGWMRIHLTPIVPAPGWLTEAANRVEELLLNHEPMVRP